MSLTDPLYVVALNYRQFAEWCARKRIHPESRSVRYVRDVAVLQRLRHPVRILFIENWGGRKDWREIYNRALVIGRRPA